MNLYVSPQADLDLIEIWKYIGARNPAAADRVIDRIETFMRGPLIEFPQMGRERQDLFEGLRSFPIRPHIIFYLIYPAEIEIVRILHGARDIPALFEDE